MRQSRTNSRSLCLPIDINGHRQSINKTRIAEQEEAVVNLRSLYEYCRDVRRTLSTFDFDDKRLALAALGVEIAADGRNWQLVGSLPGQAVEAKSASSNCLRNTCTLTLGHRYEAPRQENNAVKRQKDKWQRVV
jgi:hypothetical protein